MKVLTPVLSAAVVGAAILGTALAASSSSHAPSAPAATVNPPASPAAPAPAAHESPAASRLRDPARFQNFFRPFRTDRAAISPDGRLLAFTVREDDKLFVTTCAIDQPQQALAKVLVATDEGSSSMIVRNQGERTPAQIVRMRWVPSGPGSTVPVRLVLQTNRSVPHSRVEDNSKDATWIEWRGSIIAFDPDGQNGRAWMLPDLVAANPTVAGRGEFTVVRRDADAAFETRTQRADEPLTDQADEFVLSTPTQGDNTTSLGAIPPEGQSPVPGSLRVFSIDPQRPGAVTVRVTTSRAQTGSFWHQFISLDVATGKTVAILEDILPMNREGLIDRAGQLRLTLPNSLMRDLPHRYEYHGANGRAKQVLLSGHLGAGESAFGVSPDNYFGERSIPLGFDRNSAVLYVASNEGRDTYGVYGLDLTTKHRNGFAVENPQFDLIGPPPKGFPGTEVLVYDPHTDELAGIVYANALRTTKWLRPEWQQVQATLEQQAPGRVVELLDWDVASQRFVALIYGPADAGAIYVFDRPTNRLLEFARRAPWIDAGHSHATLTFSFPNADGTALSGLLTLPRAPKLLPTPLIVFCPAAPWQRVRPDYQTEIQALADMGFAVAQINARGAWGFGRRHRDSIRAGYDQVQVADMVTAVAKLIERFKVDPKRVAVAGIDHGGFIALRALQDHPQIFRCGVVINAPTDLAGWLSELYWANDDVQSALTRGWFGSPERLAAQPLLKGEKVPAKPVLFLHYPGPEGGTRLRTYLDARTYAARLRRAGTDVEFVELPTDYMRALPAARANAFGEIEGFLNDHIYDFSVKPGQLREIKKE